MLVREELRAERMWRAHRDLRSLLGVARLCSVATSPQATCFCESALKSCDREGRRNGVAQSTQERDKCREAEKVAKEVEPSVKIAQNCYLKTLSTANPDVRPKLPRDQRGVETKGEQRGVETKEEGLVSRQKKNKGGVGKGRKRDEVGGMDGSYGRYYALQTNVMSCPKWLGCCCHVKGGDWCSPAPLQA